MDKKSSTWCDLGTKPHLIVHKAMQERTQKDPATTDGALAGWRSLLRRRPRELVVGPEAIAAQLHALVADPDIGAGDDPDIVLAIEPGHTAHGRAPRMLVSS